MKRILTVWLLFALVLSLVCGCTLAEDDTMADTWTTNQLNILNSTLISLVESSERSIAAAAHALPECADAPFLS